MISKDCVELEVLTWKGNRYCLAIGHKEEHLFETIIQARNKNLSQTSDR
jgi:hypothetical protein